MTWKYHDFLCKAAQFSESKTCLSIGLTYYSRESVDFKLNHRWFLYFNGFICSTFTDLCGNSRVVREKTGTDKTVSDISCFNRCGQELSFNLLYCLAIESQEKKMPKEVKAKKFSATKRKKITNKIFKILLRKVIVQIRNLFAIM